MNFGVGQELRKIEARKKDRERKTQDLQKLISDASSGLSGGGGRDAGDHRGSAGGLTGADGGGGGGGSQRATPHSDKKQQVRKKTNFSTPKAKLEILVSFVPSSLIAYWTLKEIVLIRHNFHECFFRILRSTC